MSRTEANQILERVKQGAIIPPQTVNEALAATGDLAPLFGNQSGKKAEQ